MIEAQLVLLCYVVGCRKDCDQSQISFKQRRELSVEGNPELLLFYLPSVIGSENSRYPFNQTDAKLKQKQSVSWSVIHSSISQSVSLQVTLSFSQSVIHSVCKSISQSRFAFAHV